ncbi:hypothetical protein LDL59_16570 [Kaistella anthropi]|nr:hypothetical protein [Kaistella anthropi]
MKKETGILLAGSVGVILGLGIFGIKKFFPENTRNTTIIILIFTAISRKRKRRRESRRGIFGHALINYDIR